MGSSPWPLHDAATDTLFLARDRYGVKPLLWCEADARFLFGSELARLRPWVPTHRDNASVEQLFLHQFTTPRPPSTPAYTNCCPAMPCTWMPQACARAVVPPARCRRRQPARG
ncbi:MAG: hypothetical protein IPN62_16870 [Flavobacteriales bacterium]|nr:hypothetical protein [Flavobacteriales bacterium]